MKCGIFGISFISMIIVLVIVSMCGFVNSWLVICVLMFLLVVMCDMIMLVVVEIMSDGICVMRLLLIVSSV